jgi:hypothetical protein
VNAGDDAGTDDADYFRFVRDYQIGVLLNLNWM